MNGTFSERVTPLITSAMNSACFSLSMTQGPAMRNRLPEPMRMPSIWKERLKTFHRPVRRDRRENARTCKNTNSHTFVFSLLNDDSPIVTKDPGFPATRLLGGKALSCQFQWPVKHLDFCCFFFRAPLLPTLVCRAHKCSKQRMRLQRLRLEFGVKLASYEMR